VRLDDQACVLEFFENGESQGKSQFTWEDAQTTKYYDKKRGGWKPLASKHNYQNFPANMLFARAISNGVRWYAPDVFSGSTVYTPDELGAEVNGETGDVIDAEVTVEAPTPEQAPEPMPEPTPTPEPDPTPEPEDAGGDEVDLDLHAYDPSDLPDPCPWEYFHKAAVDHLGYNHKSHVLSAWRKIVGNPAAPVEDKHGNVPAPIEMWLQLRDHQEAKTA
jgi:hypothetical protein